MKLTFKQLPDFCDHTNDCYDAVLSEGVYSALDAVNTFACRNVLMRSADNVALGTYAMDMEHTEVANVMADRGVRVDMRASRDIQRYYDSAFEKLKRLFTQFTEAVTGTAYEITKLPSPQQLSEILYDKLGLPQERTLDHVTREMRPTTNAEALERMQAKYPDLYPLLKTIQQLREVNKKSAAVKSGISPDGRLRATYGTAVLETGRWNCRPYVMRNEGISFHTMTNEIRRVCVADADHVLVYCDLQSAESYCVALLSEDEEYMRACLSGDIHTFVATMLWPELPWPAGNKVDKHVIKACRPISEQQYYRHFTRRDICKRDGHLTNYDGQAMTAHKVLRLPLPLCEEFRHKYLDIAFPKIKEWHESFDELMRKPLVTYTNPFGRRRIFSGRRDAAMRREMIANGPQSTVGDAAAEGIHRIYKELDPGGPVRNEKGVYCLAHMHDAGLFSIPEKYFDELIPQVVDLMQVEIPGYNFKIPADYEVGYNWAKIDPKRKLFLDANPGGMAKPGEARPIRYDTANIYKEVV